MGEVYKARDTRLDRTVAIKVLPSHISGNTQARQRFEREARTIAALHHPHICALFDVGRQDGMDFLVMEYLEGATLAERLRKGPLPMAEALKFALQLADALDKAHRSDVVHRDFKPGNVMLTADGAKLLDFGLAKIQSEGPGASAVLSSAPTDAASLTGSGAILGTLQYMAPEQLEGDTADARTDIFAFGTVLYEMVTGQKAFQGRSQPGLMSAILTSQPPPLSQTVGTIPPLLEHVIRRCLAKDPTERWQSARDLWLELKAIGDPGSPLAAAVPTAPPKRRSLIPFAGAAAAVVVLAFAFMYWRSSSSSTPSSNVQETRFEIPVTGLSSPYYISVSPDGRRVAYLAASENGPIALWVRALNSLDARVLSGTENASVGDWSPDSRFLVFAADGKVKRIDVTGGPPQTLADIGSDVRGIYTRSTSNSEGTVVFGVNDGKGLRKISKSGGEIVQVTELDKTLAETAHSTPWFLPDGKRFLYTAWSSKPENRAIYVGSIDGKTRTRLMTTESKAVYTARGFVLFVRERTLMARPFDPSRLEFTGDASPLAEEVAYNPGFGQSAFYSSDEGTVIYYRSRGAVASGALEFFWMDRAGKAGVPLGAAVVTNFPELMLSPDGKSVVYSDTADGNGAPDVWIKDLESDVRKPLTRHPAYDESAVWSPDGRELVFGSNRDDSSIRTLYKRPANAAVPEQVLLPPESGVVVRARDWSANGNVLLMERFDRGQRNQRDIWVLPMSGDGKAHPYLQTPADEGQPTLSPNGKWLAYISNESGRYQVIVQTFPDASGGKWQISTNGGAFPRWNRNGQELFYLNAERQIVAVAVKTDKAFEAGKSTALFSSPLSFPANPGTLYPYDVSPDGQRFLMLASAAQVPGGAVTPITVILNWPAALKR